MLSRLRRASALVLASALALTLAACGDEDENQPLAGFDAVEVSGEPGETPELDWNGTLEPGDATTEVVVEGEGRELAEGDVVRVDFTIANGFTHRISYDTYDEHTVGAVVEIGEEVEPQAASDLLVQAVAPHIEEGQTVGSRIAVTLGSDQAFGDYLGSPQLAEFFANLDIGNEDGLVLVIDLVGPVGPSGDVQQAPAWAPRIVRRNGVPDKLDFSGAPAPTGELEVGVLVRGDGPVVERGQTILVSYLGQLPTADNTFDNSFRDGRGLEATVGGRNASVVDGWSQGLVGLPVGSRVMLQIPPELGYGEEGQGEDIPPNSTLYFVVDILDAADPEPPEPTETPSESASPSDGASPGEGRSRTPRPGRSATEETSE